MTKQAAIKTFRSALFYAGAVALCVPPLFVFAWMIMTGLKTGVQNIAYPPEFLFTPTLENFKAVFEQHNFFRYLMNSLIIATLSTGLSLVLGLPAAYSIAKYRQSKIGIIILLARMTPFVSYLLPWYIIFRYLKLIDTYTALTLTHLIITLPMVAWLMVAFFESVPAELEDAAMIDGCSRLKTLSHHRSAPGTKRDRHLGHHVFHLLLEPVSFLADSLRPSDQDRAGGRLQLHLLRQDRLGRHRCRRHPDRPSGLGVCLLRAQDDRAGADDGGFKGLAGC